MENVCSFNVTSCYNVYISLRNLNMLTLNSETDLFTLSDLTLVFLDLNI